MLRSRPSVAGLNSLGESVESVLRKQIKEGYGGNDSQKKEGFKPGMKE